MAKIIKDNNGKEVSEAVVLSNVLSDYFGLQPDQTITIADFMAKLKQLTPESKTELALGAAKELNYTVE